MLLARLSAWRHSRLLAIGALVLAACVVGESPASAATVTSVRSGAWSSPQTWDLGRVPTFADVVTVAHEVTLDRDATVAGVTIRRGARLTFTPGAARSLVSDGNVVVNGLLRMRPANASIDHLLRFTGAVESQFVGGGMEVLPTDDGLWVMGSGRLDIAGTPKRAWCRCSDHPTWRNGDELRVTPIGLNDFTTFAPFHPGGRVPSVAGRRAEVLNLTRNVAIEGLPGARTHIFIHSSSPQTVRHATIRHVGPRNAGGFVLGRYGIHFHHALNGSRGSVVRGVVVRDTGSHSFVPHASHGVTFRDTIAYNVTEDAYWWDFPGDCAGGAPCGPSDHNCTNDTVIDHAVAALVRPGNDPYRMSGFALQCGRRNSLTDSVAVGVQGDVDTSGFGWLEGVVESPWVFRRNVAHNNRRNGIFWWQIDCVKHVVNRFVSYRNGGNGIEHGAYLNNVTYRNVRSYQDGGKDGDAALWVVAGNRRCPPNLVFENFRINGGGYSTTAVHIDRKTGDHEGRTKLRRFTITRYRSRPIVVNEFRSSPNNDYFEIDLVCFRVGGDDIRASDIRVSRIDPLSVMRVQRRNGTAFRVTALGTFPIPSFARC